MLKNLKRKAQALVFNSSHFYLRNVFLKS
jgi:hypothetical protein